MSVAEVRRLAAGETDLARSVFALMATVLGEDSEVVSGAYMSAILSRDDAWVIAALADGTPIAGLTAWTIPLTRVEAAELLIYDIAVVPAHQRQGIGRRLVQCVRGLAAVQGIATTWVPADNEDDHALEFYRSIGGAPTAVTIFTFPDL